jgi:Domain of unknown function (DUF4391)
MRVDNILPALGLPAAAQVNESIGLRSILPRLDQDWQGRHSDLMQISSIRRLAAVNPFSTGVPAHVRAEREYLDIDVLAVAVPPKAHTFWIANALHELTLQPLIIFFARDDQVFEISLVRKSRASSDVSGNSISSGTNDCPLSDTPVDVAFFKSLNWRDLPKDDLHVVHEAWHERVDALKASRLTETFEICSDAEQTIRRRRMLAEYVGHFQDRRLLKNQLATAVSPVRRAEFDAEIQRLNAAIESIRVSLRLMTPDPGGRSGSSNSARPSRQHAVTGASCPY